MQKLNIYILISVHYYLIIFYLISIYLWKVTLNYDYSPFKDGSSDATNGSEKTEDVTKESKPVENNADHNKSKKVTCPLN